MLYLANKCSPEYCQNGGTCKLFNQSSTVGCECTPEFHGLFCQYRNACSTINPCKNGGTCVPVNDTDFHCSCPNSLVGKTCELGIFLNRKKNELKSNIKVINRGVETVLYLTS